MFLSTTGGHGQQVRPLCASHLMITLQCPIPDGLRVQLENQTLVENSSFWKICRQGRKELQARGSGPGAGGLPEAMRVAESTPSGDPLLC